MNKNESKLGNIKLGKIGKIGAAIFLALMLKGNPVVAEDFNNTQQKIVVNHNSEKSLKTLADIYAFQQNSKYMTRDQVENEVAKLIADMNKNALKLSHSYKGLEKNTLKEIKKLGLTEEDIVQIARDKGAKTPVQYDKLVQRYYAQHSMHIILNSSTLIFNNIQDAKIYDKLDEVDNFNEHVYKLIKDGDINMASDGLGIANTLRDIVVSNSHYAYQLNKDNKTAQKLANAFAEIDKIIAKGNHKGLDHVIDATAKLISEEMFGDINQRRDIVTMYITEKNLSNVLVKNNIKDLPDEKIASVYSKKHTFNPSAMVNITNREAGFELGVEAETDLNDVWDIAYGGKYVFGANTTEENKGATSHQLLTTVDFKRNFDNKQALTLGASTGLHFDKQGVSVPFGLQAGYEVQLTDRIALDFTANAKATINRSFDYGAGIAVVGRTKKGTKISFGINFGRSVEFGQGQNMPEPTPMPMPLPTPEPQTPIYGGDKVQDPGETIDHGDINDLEPGTDIDFGKF